MRLLQRALAVAMAGMIAAGTLHPSRAQASPQPPADAAPAASQTPAVTPDQTPTPLPAANAQTAAQPASTQASAPQQEPPLEKKTYTVPAGTKVLLQLRSAINTKSARQ